MRIVVSPNSFKTSASSVQVAHSLAKGMLSVDPSLEVIELPIADGGDGSLEVLLNAGFVSRSITSVDALGREIQVEIGLRKKTAFIESASIVGLRRVVDVDLQPLEATSFGLGIAIKQAIDLGCDQIVLGLGGSATTDGGAGALTALGAKFLDKEGNEIDPGGGSLIDLSHIDLSGLDPRLYQIDFLAASDVTNPLLGDLGSAQVFAPQKGANASEVERLERGLERLVQILGSDQSAAPGAGAAGGLGFMALEFLNATIVDGTSWIMDQIDYEDRAKNVDLIITGEGRYDSQSIESKVIATIKRFASDRQIPLVLVCGDITNEPVGFLATYRLIDLGSLEDVITSPGGFLERIGAEIVRDCSWSDNK